MKTYKYNRHSIRLKNYDYSKAGCYFITICTQDRLYLFGEIVDGVMSLGDAGRMIHALWYDIMDEFPNIALHEFVIMPNHIHGIIEIVDNVGADSISALKPINDDESQRAEMDSTPTNGYKIYEETICPCHPYKNN